MSYPQYPQPYPQQMPPQNLTYPPSGQPYGQQYGQPQAPLPNVSLSDYWQQPSSGGGPSLKFKDKPIGTSYVGKVARQITDGDVRAQTDLQGRPLTYKDGRPKSVMVVPLEVPVSPEFPEGNAGWWVKGQARDELVRAMAAAGAPVGPPEAGAGIRVTLTGQRPIPGMSPQYLYSVEYVRPAGVDEPAVADEAQQAPAAAPTPPPAAQQVPVVAPVTPGVAPVGAAAPAAQLSPENAALFAKLTGGQQ